jgi:FAD/FMN-containing dehydrogenase
VEYWSNQQRAVQPYCTFTPKAALEASTLVLISRLTQCPFAVKSGGHAAFPGASSIDGGITVDLVDFKQQKLSTDKKTVAIGPGNRWLDVYTYLTPYNLTVVGGRVSYNEFCRFTETLLMLNRQPTSVSVVSPWAEVSVTLLTSTVLHATM